MAERYTFTYEDLYTLLNNTIGQFMQYMEGTNVDGNDAQIRAVRDVIEALDRAEEDEAG